MYKVIDVIFNIITIIVRLKELINLASENKIFIDIQFPLQIFRNNQR